MKKINKGVGPNTLMEKKTDVQQQDGHPHLGVCSVAIVRT